MKSTVSSVPLGRPFALSLAATHKLKVVSKEIGALPGQGLALDLQSPLNKFIAGKSQREYLTGEPIFSR
jgi:hypothetical protein